VIACAQECHINNERSIGGQLRCVGCKAGGACERWERIPNLGGGNLEELRGKRSEAIRHCCRHYETPALAEKPRGEQ